MRVPRMVGMIINLARGWTNAMTLAPWGRGAQVRDHVARLGVIGIKIQACAITRDTRGWVEVPGARCGRGYDGVPITRDTKGWVGVPGARCDRGYDGETLPRVTWIQYSTEINDIGHC